MAELGFINEQGEAQELESDLGKEEKDELKKNEEYLKPWEQHSTIISIPRFNYKTPSSLLDRSISGFLITCPIKREKSATKEAILILEEHMSSVCTNGLKRPGPCSKNEVEKRRKICSQVVDNLDKLENNTDANLSSDSCEIAVVGSLPPVEGENAKKSSNLSLVKLTRSGLLLFTLPNLNYQHVIDTLSSIFRSLASGNQKPPIWCHRIFPIQETCRLIEKELQAVVTNLAQWYFNGRCDKLERSIKFAVGYNRRGIEETELKNKRCTSEIDLLERNKCFSVVAGAFKKVMENSIVDLNSPEVVILVELLPLSGLPPHSLMAGVSVLPCEYIITKPRLSIKPLTINNTERNKSKVL